MRKIRDMFNKKFISIGADYIVVSLLMLHWLTDIVTISGPGQKIVIRQYFVTRQ